MCGEAVHRLNQGKGIARKQTKHPQQLLEPVSGEARIYQKESSLLSEGPGPERQD